MKRALFILIICLQAAAGLSSRSVDNSAAIGFSLGYSAGLFSGFSISSASIVDVCVFVEIAEILEAAAGIRYGDEGSGDITREPSPLLSIEFRFAPFTGLYNPYIAAGYAHYSYEGGESFKLSSSMNTPYAAAAPLRFSFAGMPWIPEFMKFSISFMEIRYGPVFPVRKYPGFSSLGNFLGLINVVRAGAVFSFKGKADSGSTR